MEAIMRSFTQLTIGMSVVGVTSIGSAVAQPAAEQEKNLINRPEPAHSEIDLNDHQRLRGYFLDGSRDRLR
jgi:hypothetical protein